MEDNYDYEDDWEFEDNYYYEKMEEALDQFLDDALYRIDLEEVGDRAAAEDPIYTDELEEL